MRKFCFWNHILNLGLGWGLGAEGWGVGAGAGAEGWAGLGGLGLELEGRLGWR